MPVKSANPIPKGMMFECMKVINKASIKARVNTGDVVVENFLGTGVDIIATNYAE